MSRPISRPISSPILCFVLCAVYFLIGVSLVLFACIAYANGHPALSAVMALIVGVCFALSCRFIFQIYELSDRMDRLERMDRS